MHIMATCFSCVPLFCFAFWTIHMDGLHKSSDVIGALAPARDVMLHFVQSCFALQALSTSLLRHSDK